MIQKVLIAEDHEGENLSVQVTLDELKIVNVDHVYYCDDALARLKLAEANGEPYDLLITDLTFDEDEQPQRIKDGEQLIREAHEISPALKILVFSGEGRPAVIDSLKRQNIDGYVRKARNDKKDLKLAIESLSKHKQYFPRHLLQRLHENAYDFQELDIAIISLLSRGIAQKDMPAYFIKHKMEPYSLSNVEKRLKRIKDELGFTKNEQLISYCKDMGII